MPEIKNIPSSASEELYKTVLNFESQEIGKYEIPGIFCSKNLILKFKNDYRKGKLTYKSLLSKSAIYASIHILLEDCLIEKKDTDYIIETCMKKCGKSKSQATRCISSNKVCDKKVFSPRFTRDVYLIRTIGSGLIGKR